MDVISITRTAGTTARVRPAPTSLPRELWVGHVMQSPVLRQMWRDVGLIAPDSPDLIRRLQRLAADPRPYARPTASPWAAGAARAAIGAGAASPIGMGARIVARELVQRGILQALDMALAQGWAPQRGVAQPLYFPVPGGIAADPAWVRSQGPGGGSEFTSTGVAGPYPADNFGIAGAWRTWFDTGLFTGATAYEATLSAPNTPAPGLDTVTWYAAWEWTGPATTPAEALALRPTVTAPGVLAVALALGQSTPAPTWRQAATRGRFVRGYSQGLQGAKPADPLAYQGGYSAGPPGRAAAPAPRNARSPEARGRNRRLNPKLEKKIAATGAAKGLMGVLGAATEGMDAIDAVYMALPPELRRAVRNAWVQREFDRGVRRPAKQIPHSLKLRTIAENLSLLSPEGVVRELAWEAFEDVYYGIVGRAVGRGVNKITRSRNPHPTASPGYEHALSPRLPTEDLEAWVTMREGRTYGSDVDGWWRHGAQLARAYQRKADWRGRLLARVAYRGS